MQPFSEQFLALVILCGGIALPITQLVKKLLPNLGGWSAWIASAVVSLAVVFVQAAQASIAMPTAVLLWIIVTLEANGIYLFGAKVIGKAVNGK